MQADSTVNPVVAKPIGQRRGRSTGATGGVPLLCVLLSLSLQGCSVFQSRGDPEYSVLGGGVDRVSSAGVHQLFGPGFEKVDLVQMLVPEGLSEDDTRRCDALAAKGSDLNDGCRIDAAFDQYHRGGAASAQGTPLASRDNAATRNVIQDRLIAASDQRCNLFLNYIQRHQSATNFSLGALTTFLAGGGAIASGATVARALAGSAGIVSGVRAEYDQNFFYNQTVVIISQGIRAGRKSVLDQIDQRRGTDGATGVAAYTVERAVSDALRYHGTCTIAAGLETSSKTLSLDAGLDEMNNKLQQQIALQDKLRQLNGGPSATVAPALPALPALPLAPDAAASAAGAGQ